MCLHDVVEVRDVMSKRQGPVLGYKAYDGWDWLNIMGICDDNGLEGRAFREARSCERL